MTRSTIVFCQVFDVFCLTYVVPNLYAPLTLLSFSQNRWWWPPNSTKNTPQNSHWPHSPWKQAETQAIFRCPLAVSFRKGYQKPSGMEDSGAGWQRNRFLDMKTLTHGEIFSLLEREKTSTKSTKFSGDFIWILLGRVYPPASGVGMALRTWVLRHRSSRFREWFYPDRNDSNDKWEKRERIHKRKSFKWKFPHLIRQYWCLLSLYIVCLLDLSYFLTPNVSANG